METGTKQLRVRGNIRHTGTTWIVGQASRLSPSFWFPFRRITETGTKQVRVHRNSQDARKPCAHRITCFRHPAGRTILPTGTPCAPRFRPRKHLITNECQPIKAYSTPPPGGSELGTQISPEYAKNLFSGFLQFLRFFASARMRVGAPRSALRVPISAAVPGPNKTRHRQVTAQPTQ